MEIERSMPTNDFCLSKMTKQNFPIIFFYIFYSLNIALRIKTQVGLRKSYTYWLEIRLKKALMPRLKKMKKNKLEKSRFIKDHFIHYYYYCCYIFEKKKIESGLMYKTTIITKKNKKLFIFTKYWNVWQKKAILIKSSYIRGYPRYTFFSQMFVSVSLNMYIYKKLS